MFVDSVFQAPNCLGGKWIGSIQYDGAEATALAASHLVGRRTPYESQLLDHPENPLPGVRSDSLW